MDALVASLGNQRTKGERMTKKTYSTDNIKPSKEFNELEYSLYLQYATLEELENDKVSHITAKKIIYDADGLSSIVDVFYKEKKTEYN
jgi:hypothetical protein